MSYQSEHDPRWHLGQCLVWIATRDLAAVHEVEVRGIAGAIRALYVDAPQEEVRGPPTKDGHGSATGFTVRHTGALPPKIPVVIDRYEGELLAEFCSGRLGATAIPAGETTPREIKPAEFHGLKIGFSGLGTAPPHLHRGPRIIFTDVRVFREHLLKSFRPPATAPADDLAPAPAASPAVVTTSSKPRKEKPGPKTDRRGQVMETMRAELRDGRRTRAELENMPDKLLVSNYPGAGHTTIWEARRAVLSEFSEFSEISGNSNNGK